MRGVETRIQEIRHRIFREVARMAYHTEWPVDKRIEELPYKIIPGEVGNFRNDVFLERAIVSERLRLAMGLPYRGAADPAPVSTGIEEADKPETYYTPPLINVIKFACNACPEKRVYVTDGCQGCLAHPCVEVCPKDAVTLDRTNGRSKIDPDKCIRCGQCANVCAYHAIIIQERPCAAACGMDAIHSDMNGKADIDYNKCVSCGQCLVNCPFGAIADKSQIFQVIRAIQTGERVYAAVAPAFVGQFGPKVTPGKLRAAMKALGFADVFEVAIGADLCAVQEAEDFVKEVPEQLPFMATSCCPAWSVMAKKLFPDFSNCISMALTPMTLTARLIKKKHEKGKVVFIGPCAAKKLEAMRTSVRSDVDFVLTFEEMAGIFDAKHVDIENMEEDPDGVNDASTDEGWTKLCGCRRCREIRGGCDRTDVSGEGDQGCERGRLKGVQETPSARQSRKVQRLSSGRNGMPGRLRCRCRNDAAGQKISGCGKPLCGKSRTCDERQDRVCERTG